uniref:ABC transporter permease n=1 Tax=Tessaracoccus timonensis TaxID=2161816 RepID=UPI00131F3504|nr:FtsX-like permease family protein [Tessaracoccus timonensis]
MWHFAITQMRSSVGKLVLAGIAIVLGTGFVSATLLGTSIMKATAEAVATADLNGADVAAKQVNITDEQLAAVRATPGVKTIDYRLNEGVPVGNATSTYFLQLQSLPTAGDAPTPAEGTTPKAPGELLIAHDLAKSLHVRAGDTLQWSGPEDKGREFKIVGVTQPSMSLLSTAPSWATAETVQQVRAAYAEERVDNDTLLVYTDGSRNPSEVGANIAKQIPYPVHTAQEVIDQQVESMVGNANFFVFLGLAFAAVAVGVAAMVIANTFEVLVAQRTKALALLRCGGATKAQIRRSVLIEAAVLGGVASVVGILLGHGLGYAGLWWVSTQSSGAAKLGSMGVNIPAILVPLIVGLVVTVLAALGPARAATRVSPVAALRPTTVDPVRTKSGLRKAVGLTLLILGALMLGFPTALVYGYRADGDLTGLIDLLGVLLLMGVAGGLLLVAGFLVLAVYMVPQMVAVLGWLVALVVPKKSKATVRLATANATRNPRRTAATTSALVIGVGLVTLMATGAASGRATIENSLDKFYPTEVVVSVNGTEAFSDNLVKAVEGVEGVKHVARAWMASDTEGKNVMIAKRDDVLATVKTPVYTLQPGRVGVDPRPFPQGVPDEMTLSIQTPSGEKTKPITLPTQTVKNLAVAMVVEPETIEQSGAQLGQPTMLLLNVDDERVDDVVLDVQRVVSEHGGDSAPSVAAPLQQRQNMTRVIDAVVAVMIGLLAVAVVIALVGVANTLTLSVIERRREHGMLRSVGVTGSQLRGMLAAEGVLISVAGAVIGILLGVLTGFAGSTILLGSADGFVFALDWRVLLGTLAVAVVAGLIASVVPSRSAARVPVVVALAAE